MRLMFFFYFFFFKFDILKENKMKEIVFLKKRYENKGLLFRYVDGLQNYYLIQIILVLLGNNVDLFLLLGIDKESLDLYYY